MLFYGFEYYVNNPSMFMDGIKAELQRELYENSDDKVKEFARRMRDWLENSSQSEEIWKRVINRITDRGEVFRQLKSVVSRHNCLYGITEEEKKMKREILLINTNNQKLFRCGMVLWEQEALNALREICKII